MTFEQPPRLKDSPDLGALIRAAGEAKVTPERLADNAAGIKALIAAGATTALWKLLLPLLLLLAVIAPIVAKLVLSDDDEPPPKPAPAIAAAPAPAPDAHEADPIDAAPEPEPATPIATPARKPTPRVAAVTVDAAVEDAPPAKSELAVQVEMYRAARDAGLRGEVARGIDLIDDLLRQYPATPLRAEADLTRADFLARANRLDEAARAVEDLVRDGAHGGRRGELLRTLGDLYRRQGDCTRAVDAYTRALAERLSDRDRADVQRGRDRCTPR